MKSNRLMWSLPLSILIALATASCGGDDNNNTPTGPNPTTEAFDSGDLNTVAPTNVFVHTFATAGSFGYRCIHHAGMNGTVTVTAAGADSPGVTVASNTFTPATVQVKPGGYVKWTNTSGIHTVTRP